MYVCAWGGVGCVCVLSIECLGVVIVFPISLVLVSLVFLVTQPHRIILQDLTRPLLFFCVGDGKVVWLTGTLIT